MVNSFGLIKQVILDILKIIIFMEKDNINGMMEDNIQEIGYKIKCMEMEYLNRRMEDNILENIKMIKKKDQGNQFGLTGKNFMDNG